MTIENLIMKLHEFPKNAKVCLIDPDTLWDMPIKITLAKDGWVEITGAYDEASSSGRLT